MKNVRRIRRDLQLVEAEIVALEKHEMAPKVKCRLLCDLENRRVKLAVALMMEQLKKVESDD